jgi:hypothetical protein
MLAALCLRQVDIKIRYRAVKENDSLLILEAMKNRK